MFPIVLDLAQARVALVGNGEAALRRLALLDAVDIVLAVELAASRLAELSATARAVGVLVNIEDRPELSSFHSPALLRRGDLLIAVSTNGQSPGLASRVKRFLAELFGVEWQGRLDALSALRQGWREAGAGPAEIKRWTDEWIDRHHWLGEGGERVSVESRHFLSPRGEEGPVA